MTDWCRPEYRLRLYARALRGSPARVRCAYCEKPVAFGVRSFGRVVHQPSDTRLDLVTVDHVIPRDTGGTNIASNLAVSCWRCNGAKLVGFADSPAECGLPLPTLADAVRAILGAYGGPPPMVPARLHGLLTGRFAHAGDTCSAEEGRGLGQSPGAGRCHHERPRSEGPRA